MTIQSDIGETRTKRIQRLTLRLRVLASDSCNIIGSKQEQQRVEQHPLVDEDDSEGLHPDSFTSDMIGFN